jgi:hypothetical protein
MSLTVKVLGRSRLEGGGHNIIGVAKNNKVETWGELSGTYVTTGIAIVPADFGLVTLDHLDLQPVTFLGGAGVGRIDADTAIKAVVDEPNAVIRCQTIASSGALTESTQTAYVINFRAVGDSATPEL